MHLKIVRAILPFATLFVLNNSYGQSGFYEVNTIQKIEIFFSQSNWDQQLDSIKYATDGYLKADSVKVNGSTFTQVGVKYKGNSSYDSTYQKNPLTISLDKYKNHSYQGFTSIKLSNCYQDPSMIREVLAYDILSKYMACPRANFSQVYINGQPIGLYSNVEDISKSFCADKFLGNKSNTFIKCNPLITPGPNVKSNLKYISNDSADYTNFYELKSNAGLNELISLCSTATFTPNKLAEIVDMDRFIWMLAFNNLMINLDSYSGAFSQNYYIYKDDHGIFNPIVWDLNMCFGGFPFAGSSNTSLGTLSIANMKQFPINFHESDPHWPIINAVMGNPEWKKKYITHMKTMLNEMIVSNYYLTLSTSLLSNIDTAAKSDQNKFFSNAQFNASSNTDITAGSYMIPSISNLLTARATYLLASTEFNYQAPSIISINSKSGPTIDSAIITAYIKDADKAMIGSRQAPSQSKIKTMMFDDGKHSDGVAGDNIYGATISYNYNTTELYIYAENNNAGTFSPPRAEYELQSLKQLTGVKQEFEPKFACSVYPNPSQTLFHISFNSEGNHEIEIYDYTGKLIDKFMSQKQLLTLHTEEWSSGLYYLKVDGVLKKLVVN